MIDAVLDTDTFNEIDDQFALSYLIRATERIRVRGLYAAPFFNEKSVSPKDGMEKSYDEILTLLTLLGGLREQGIDVVLCGLPSAAMTMLRRAGVVDLLGEEAFYWSIERALLDLRPRPGQA